MTKLTVYPYGIIPETPLEGDIINSEIFRLASESDQTRYNHSEGKIGVHISQIMDYLDTRNWERFRTDLRVIALLHDLGKSKVERNKTGKVLGKKHEDYSVEIARDFISDERLLKIIGAHDAYLRFHKDKKRNRLNISEFLDVYRTLDLPTLTRFMYADRKHSDIGVVASFENLCYALGLTDSRLYKIEPGLSN